MKIRELRLMIRKTIAEGRLDRRRDFAQFIMKRDMRSRRDTTAATYLQAVNKLIAAVGSDDDLAVRKHIQDMSEEPSERWRKILAKTAWNAYQHFLRVSSYEQPEDQYLDADVDQEAPLPSKFQIAVDEFVDALSHRGADQNTLVGIKKILIRLLRSLENGTERYEHGLAEIHEIVNSLTADKNERRLYVRVWRAWREFLKTSHRIPRFWGDKPSRD